jgi:stress response protein YsnF
MAGVDIDTALDWRGRTVVDRDGEKIGTLREIYLDEDDRPAWASVYTALFGLRETVVPLSQASLSGEDVRLPYDGDHVKQAPNVDPDVQLSPDDEERLYRHYEIGDRPDDDGSDDAADTERPGAEAAPGEPAGAPDEPAAAPAASDESVAPPAASDEPAAAPASPPAEEGRARTPDDGEPARQDSETDDAMTRSEEEVTVGKRQRVRGRARLRKYVVTDYVEKKVPVQREEVRLEYEPAGDEPGKADAD